MPLSYPPFVACNRIQEAVGGPGHWFNPGEAGDGVAILQGGLISLGYAMPRSTRKGYPDGIYGNETIAAVKKFQERPVRITVDGLAGRATVTKLDKALSAKFPKTPKQPPKPPLPGGNGGGATKGRYILGTAAPATRPDPGAGPWKSKPWEMAYYTAHAFLLHQIRMGNPILMHKTGSNAMRLMQHYLENTGAPVTINLESMLAAVPKARFKLEDEIIQARVFCETLPPGSHAITSKKVQYRNYNPARESTDWFFAVGGYQRWGKGVVTTTETSSGTKHYSLEFEYHIFDPYNWDKGGKSVQFSGFTIKDEDVGEFHRQGLAKEFLVSGMVRRKIEWEHQDLTETVTNPDQSPWR